MIAYKILGLEFTNDNGIIRDAYRRSVMKYSPEKAPDQYKIIRKAYELIETEQKRLEYYLFGSKDDVEFEEYTSLCLKIDKSISSEKWERLCQLYQENKSK